MKLSYAFLMPQSPALGSLAQPRRGMFPCMTADQWGTEISAVAGVFLAIAATVQFFRTKRHTALILAISAYLMLFPVHLWFWQFLLTVRGIPHSYIYEAAFQIVSAIGFLTWLSFSRFRPLLTAVALTYTFSLILQLFSYMYWSYGVSGKFSVSLTHLDSFYFALGTFTTAGTGNLAPLTETTRGLQTLQMGLDFILIGFVVVLVMTRYTNLLDRPEAPSPRETALLQSIVNLTGTLSPKALDRSRAAQSKDIPPIAPPADWSQST